jgi:hypothetical protein
MRVFAAAFVIALLVGPAYAQSEHVPTYREEEKDKTRQQIEAEKEAQSAYQRSLGSIPDKGPSDPWGNVRSDSAPKTAAKPAPAKRTKTGSRAN